jgi:hypothetical protein
MARKQVHPESRDEPKFCVVSAESRGAYADNHPMSSPVRRPAEISLRIRRNFAKRDWTSIGLRGLRVTGKASTRTKLKSAGSGLSYVHSEKSRSIGIREPAPDHSLNLMAPPEKDWRGLFWIVLILLAIAAAVAQVMK